VLAGVVVGSQPHSPRMVVSFLGGLLGVPKRGSCR